MSNQQLVENIISLDKPGREKTIKLCDDLGWKFEEPERSDLAYDCIIKFDSSMFAVVEIKNRDIKYDKYPTLFLQEDKYNNLLKWKQRLNADQALYINWIDNKCYIFDIDKVDKNNIKEKWMNKITANPAAGKTLKRVYELNKKDAIFVFNDEENFNVFDKNAFNEE